MDKVFKEENFVCNFIRKCKSSSGNRSKHIAVEFDYLLCYAKNKQKLAFTQTPIDPNNTKYCFSDHHEKRRGKYALRDLEYKGAYSKTLDYIIKAPDCSELLPGNKIGAPHTWR